MMPPPKLRDPILLFLVAALFATVALKATFLPDWLRTFLMLCAMIFGLSGVVTASNWVMYMAGLRIREINKARIEGAYSLAMALHGLTMRQTELVARHDVIEIGGILGQEDIAWTIRAPGGDLPWEFMEEFLIKSKETQPYLWPIRKHDEMDWQNSEQLCTIATNLIRSRGWAERASGPYAAKLTTDLGLVVAKFGVDLDG